MQFHHLYGQTWPLQQQQQQQQFMFTNPEKKLLVPQIATKLVEARQDEYENIMENKNYNKLQNMLEKRERKKNLTFT